jgi:hypothetical protein
MTDRDESSTLIALAELRSLEADRIAEEEAARRAREEAARRAEEEAARRVREAAERQAAAEAARVAREAAEREAREREARLRLQEAELQARAEQEARLRQEQMRLDAQIKITEREARPLWLTVTPIALGLCLAAGGFFAWSSMAAHEHEVQVAQKQAAKIDAENSERLAEAYAQLDALKSEQGRLERERAELDAELSKVQDEAKRQRLLAEKSALDSKLKTNRAKQSGRASRSVRKDRGADERETSPSKPKEPAIEVLDTKDPLEGLFD